MGVSKGGQADRWARLAAADQHDPLAKLVNAVIGLKPDGPVDPAEAFAAAVSRRKPRKRSDIVNVVARGVAEGKAELAAIHAGRQARAQRNMPKASAAYAQWQRARAAYAAEDGVQLDELAPSAVFASLGIGVPGPSRIW